MLEIEGIDAQEQRRKAARDRQERKRTDRRREEDMTGREGKK